MHQQHINKEMGIHHKAQPLVTRHKNDRQNRHTIAQCQTAKESMCTLLCSPLIPAADACQQVVKVASLEPVACRHRSHHLQGTAWTAR